MMDKADAIEIKRLIDNGEPLGPRSAGLGYTPGEGQDLLDWLAAQGPEQFSTELTEIGEQYVIPGTEHKPKTGEQGNLF